jgi:membrane protein DedA with SNARE-associated domain
MVREIKLPIILIIVFTFLHILSIFEILPNINYLSLEVKKFFDDYGIVSVGILSFIENIVFINAYFPGSIVILTGMAMTSGDPIRGLITYLTIFFFAFMAYNFNYFIGRFLSRNKPINSNKVSVTLFLSSFWHPHFAAMTCLKTGVDGYSYYEFLKKSLLVGFIWNSFWGVFMYNFGSFTGGGINLIPLMYLYLFGWLISDIFKYKKRTQK